MSLVITSSHFPATCTSWQLAITSPLISSNGCRSCQDTRWNQFVALHPPMALCTQFEGIGNPCSHPLNLFSWLSTQMLQRDPLQLCGRRWFTPRGPREAKRPNCLQVLVLKPSETTTLFQVKFGCMGWVSAMPLTSREKDDTRCSH